MHTTKLLVILLAATGCVGTMPDVSAPALIENSGSTNASAFRLNVSVGGSVTWHNDPARNIPNALACSAADGTTTLDPVLVSRLFNDLQAASEAAPLHYDNCPRSVSFGTRTTVTYGAAEFTNVDCGSMTDTVAAAVTRDVNEVQAAVATACH